jgi:hypothetical protein
LYSDVVLSPDGKWAATSRYTNTTGQGMDLWLLDLAAGAGNALYGDSRIKRVAGLVA